MTFKSAYLKLTLFYVLIVMIISISFSLVLYRISSTELGRGLGQQTRFLRELPINDRPSFQIPDFEKIRLEQLEESSNRLRLNLIYFNIFILILSSGISYFLARRTLRPIEEMMDAQNRFTADASHELKTPLTAMRTEIEVSLREKKMSIVEARKLLSSNLEEIGKLESLSGALLKLAKYQEDFKLEFEKVVLTEVITEAYEKVEGLAKEKSIEFKNNFKEIYAKGDKQSLVELFVILLDNAIKYSPKESKISINVEKEKHGAIVKIKDQGIGIKALDLPHIFDRFYRADISRTKEKVDGYGLGLSIAKRIVELHGGTISANSKPGKGSEFIIKLPKF
ncbi:MAG: HAMP domain-containing sensor histidine kinase [Candidatus Berkelbacteria bacterium]|nr:HAMP domain-containing sensor histidine kinase [Candidatus Berkelbacteria bacterium]